MLKVLHVAKIAQIAGAERHLLALLPGLRTADLDVRMLVLENPAKPADEFVEQLTAAQVPVTRMAYPLRDSLLSARSPRFLADLRGTIRAQAPDIVHTHLIHSDLYGALAAKLAGVPQIVCTRHNLDPFRQRRQWQIVTALLWRQASGGIAVSNAVRDFVLRYEHAAPHKIHTIYYGIAPYDAAESPSRAQMRVAWGVPLDAPVVGTVARLVKQKGLHHGLEAFAQVRQQVPDAHYVLAGEGDRRAELEALAGQLGIKDNVHFLGWQRDAHAVLNAVDVLLLPSLWEGLPVSFLEAMSHGLPIVSTAIGPVQEAVIDGETGFLVPPGDSEALVVPLQRLLTDAALRQRMGEAGQQRVKAVFSQDKMVQLTAEFYQSL
ncbi:MAG: glycosyltransferase [Anaerolineae bacterium]|nr:glycosyltransferase [Anaerolineae bacterium]